MHDEVPSDLWTERQAEHYDDDSDEAFSPELLDRIGDFLAELAGSGEALEFAIGTGRVAIPLHTRGVAVQGIEYSEHMAAVLRRKAPDIPVVVGDMATTRVDGEFSLVYLVYNTQSATSTPKRRRCSASATRHTIFSPVVGLSSRSEFLRFGRCRPVSLGCCSTCQKTTWVLTPLMS